MKLQETVSFVKGPALKVIPKLAGPFDFVFIDAWKEEYLGYLQAVEPKLKRRAIIVADNAIRFADEMRDSWTRLRAIRSISRWLCEHPSRSTTWMIVVCRR